MAFTLREMTKITNEPLEREFMTVRSQIHSAKRSKTNSVDLEVYFCYLSRELQIRRSMKKKAV